MRVQCSQRQGGRQQTARRFSLLESRPTWQAQLVRLARCEASELCLWASVLNDAIAALRGRHSLSRPRGGHLFGEFTEEQLWREALAWILSRESEPLGTFESVCDVLRLSVDAVRRDLLALALSTGPRLGPQALMFTVSMARQRVERALEMAA